MVDWAFIPRGAMTMSADQMANPLQNTYLSQAELLMREAIQNSVDERRPDAIEPVKFRVRRLLLSGDEKRAIVQNFKLDDLNERSQHFPEALGWFKRAETCLPTLNDPDVPISMLILSDYNTNGLGGQWDRMEGPESRFHNLVLSINVSEKFENVSGSLGSYGVGKMVYAVTSKIRTMAYYSSFQPTESTDGATARFMATAFFPAHTAEDGMQLTGHAFFGESSGNERYPSKPLENSSAHDFAQAIGLEQRSNEDLGLSVALLDCDLDITDCMAACEKFWWPRIMELDPSIHVDIEFFDGDKRLPNLRPRQRRELNPFIDCYNNLKQSVKPDGYELHNILPNSGSPGKLCLKAILIPEGKTADDVPYANEVALIRNGLVIQYNSEYAREDDAAAVGVFEAQGESIRAFTLSEPEAHDNWNPNHDRLIRALGDDSAKLVKGTHSAIRMRFRDFQLRQSTRKENNIGDGLDFLDKLLGSLFRRRKQGKSKPPSARPRAFSVTKRGWRDLESNPTCDELDFTVSIADDLDIESVRCKIQVVLTVLADADGSPKDRVRPVIHSSEGDILASENDKEFLIILEKGKRQKFRSRAQVHKSWRTKWIVNVMGEPGEVTEP